MTDELNAVALSRAVLGYKDAIAFGGEHEEGIEGAIRAYMSALPSPAGLDAAEFDMVRHGDFTGPELGAKVAALLNALPPPSGKAGEVVERPRGLLANVSDGGHEYPMSLEEATAIAARITALVAERDGLLNGTRAVIPRTRKHAEDLYTVAVACLKSYGVDPEAEAARLREALETTTQGRAAHVGDVRTCPGALAAPAHDGKGPPVKAYRTAMAVAILAALLNAADRARQMRIGANRPNSGRARVG